MRPTWQPLPIAARAELASLILMLLNLVTVHWPAVSSVIGPLHGCFYLFVIIATARHPQGTGRLTALALIPGIGGLLVTRRLDRPRPVALEPVDNGQI
ncbi:DUF3817 domain-containing protein [Streptomyces varsoviensis]|uniref:DUF3817 domain-containing protein n=1 Tax=Streptomyces varsoviensis TaxID=67373 RepID=UPI0033C85700